MNMTAAQLRSFLRKLKRPDTYEIHLQVGAILVETTKTAVIRSLRGINDRSPFYVLQAVKIEKRWVGLENNHETYKHHQVLIGEVRSVS